MYILFVYMHIRTYVCMLHIENDGNLDDDEVDGNLGDDEVHCNLSNDEPDGMDENRRASSPHHNDPVRGRRYI